MPFVMQRVNINEYSRLSPLQKAQQREYFYVSDRQHKWNKK